MPSPTDPTRSIQPRGPSAPPEGCNRGCPQLRLLHGSRPFWAPRSRSRRSRIGPNLTRSRGSLPVRVRNRCPMVTPKDTGVFWPGSRSECEQAENQGKRGKFAEFSGESANGRSGAALTSRPKCSTGRREWLPIGHRTRTNFSRCSENQGLSCGCSQCPMVPGRDHERISSKSVRQPFAVNTAENAHAGTAGTRC